jgi:hypothetical protein
MNNGVFFKFFLFLILVQKFLNLLQLIYQLVKYREIKLNLINLII